MGYVLPRDTNHSTYLRIQVGHDYLEVTRSRQAPDGGQGREEKGGVFAFKH